jgi:hypothetical protein
MQTQKPAANTQMQYHIEQEIGNGTFGKVYLVRKYKFNWIKKGNCFKQRRKSGDQESFSG